MTATKFNTGPAIGLCLLAAWASLAAPAAQAKKASSEPGVMNAAMIAGDPMSPINPFNGGADPLTMPGDARIGVFPYSRDQIYRVLTAPLKLTTIELEKGEKLIADPAMGDSVQWEIDDDKMNHVFIKPHKADLVNTLHLTTNLREYDFTLIASPAGGMFYQTVRFQYPRALMARAGARDDASGTVGNGGRGGVDSGSISVAPDKLNWDYSVDGRAEFTPETVFDDGHAVWMRMPAKAQEWPVPFILDHGDRVVANFIRRGDFLVLQRLADEIVLRSGKDEVTVTRGRRRILGVF
ncbi:conjugal transfer protein TrbG/VirB9/CagX [Caballeronia arvi]|uniref:Conjugal transfer protein TrbG/VirB9/CagX n=1 Tax=Caballeronia arvi TaxID=1777135 RepID=A0A158KUR9_9BURK|nr:TrbG/VirB9 family P-type conjugative transfer protein [Caballeronia arvi]SAL84725.1 conjugal transfer protein TrbG/VirB9/CagX [Caballeronia arvi]